jgi:hypothetical protein
MPPEPPVTAGPAPGATVPFRPVMADGGGPPTALPARRSLIRNAIGFFFSVVFGGLGIGALILGLAVVATIPVLQFLSLGYLLEVSGRIGRTGRLRAGFIGLKPAGVAGLFLAGLGIIWLVLRYLSSMAINAEIIAPGSGAGRTWGFFAVLGVGLLTAAALGLFLVVQFFRPSTYADLRDGLWHMVTQRVPYYFWLGLRGFVAGLIWLAVPVSLMVGASLMPHSDRPSAGGLTALGWLSGSLLLGAVALHLPFLQTQMAAENRFRAAFNVVGVYKRFWRSPIFYAAAVVVALLFALPLYLLKIELVPADAAWLPSLLFVMFMFPARVLAGWAYARGLCADRPLTNARIVLRLVLCGLAFVLMLAAGAFYVLIVFFSQFTVWHGVWGMYEQHAFLLPVPFLGG